MTTVVNMMPQFHFHIPPNIFGLTVVTTMTDCVLSPELMRPLKFAAASSHKDRDTTTLLVCEFK